MSNKFYSYPKIGQFKNAIKDVREKAKFQGLDGEGQPILDSLATLPTLTFYGTTKLHGTNAGILYKYDNTLYTQSRKRVITVKDDNAGFAYFVESNRDSIDDFCKLLRQSLIKLAHDNDIELFNTFDMCVFGEWAGMGINKGCSIHNLEKAFYIFGIKLVNIKNDETFWVPMGSTENGFSLITLLDYMPQSTIGKMVDNNIEFLCQPYFDPHCLDIDFYKPQLATIELEKLTLAVEKECPVGKHFGVDKLEPNGNNPISLIGEGIVWESYYKGKVIRFKVKGAAHSSSKVKVLAAVDPEKLEGIHKFVNYAVTENRLNQGIEQVFTSNNIEPDIKLTGKFLSWVTNDILDEEMDVILESELEVKMVRKHVPRVACDWFRAYLDKNI